MDVHQLFEIRMNYRLISDDGPYSGAALSPRTLVSFAANDATVMSTAIKAIQDAQRARDDAHNAEIQSLRDEQRAGVCHGRAERTAPVQVSRTKSGSSGHGMPIAQKPIPH